MGKLIVGHEVAICDECVDFCQGLLKSNKDKSTPASTSPLDPAEIHRFLDQYVVGQQHAKVVLCVAIVNHYKRIMAGDSTVHKANVMMIGPTGTGKTLLAQTAARFLDVPFVIADATTLTEAGYVGDDAETMIARLYMAADGDVEKTQRGIVFLDEVDKLARKSESASVSRDVSGEGVQQALLKLVEGTKCRISISGARKSASDTVEIDTRNILFIVGGAFVGLDQVLKQRQSSSAIGFGAQVGQQVVTDVQPDDLIRYGMIPELVGRFPNVITLHDLTKLQMLQILKDVKHNLVDQYRWLFSQDGIDLDFEPSTLDLIVDRAMTARTGARGLHRELERVLLPHMYNLPRYRSRNLLRIAIDQNQVNNPVELQQGNE